MGLDASFSAELQIIDGNPFVLLPPAVLSRLFADAGRSTRPIPVRGHVNGRPYRQTLVKFRGAWRLYINMSMLDDSPRRVGEVIEVAVLPDPDDRTVEPRAELVAMLHADPAAEAAFGTLTPSRQKEIIRYINGLKGDASVVRNVGRVRAFLLGEGRLVGRDGPSPKG